MASRSRKSVGALGLAAALGLVAAACGSSSTASSDTTTSGAAETTTTAAPAFDYASLSGNLKGSGSSFQDTFDQAVKVKFQTVATGLTVDYAKSSSGQGIADLAAQTVDFAGTDRAVKDTEKAGLKGGDILYFPTVAAPITVSYNLSGVDKATKLKLGPVALAKIFSGTVTSWDDAAITGDNSGVAGLTGAIVVCHRSDDSGTTNNFTTYLSSADKADLTLEVGSNPTNWPAGSIGAEKNGGVASCISTNPGAIGYVDVADAIKGGLSYASIKNSSGQFVQPDLAGTQAALEGAASTLKPDLTYSPLNASGEKAYPITSPTWIIVYKTQTDATRGAALKGWLNYILTDGQDLAASAGYGALPDAIKSKAIAQLDQLVVPS